MKSNKPKSSKSKRLSSGYRADKGQLNQTAEGVDVQKTQDFLDDIAKKEKADRTKSQNAKREQKSVKTAVRKAYKSLARDKVKKGEDVHIGASQYFINFHWTYSEQCNSYLHWRNSSCLSISWRIWWGRVKNWCGWKLNQHSLKLCHVVGTREGAPAFW